MLVCLFIPFNITEGGALCRRYMHVFPLSLVRPLSSSLNIPSPWLRVVYHCEAPIYLLLVRATIVVLLSSEPSSA